MKPTLRVVESGASELRLRAAEQFLTGLPAGTEVLLVAASRGAADDLARRVAAREGATFGLHRFSFTQLAARLASTALAARGLAPATMLAADAVAARAAFEADRQAVLTYFAPVAHMPGFAPALARTMLELRLADVRPGAVAGLPRGGPDLAALLERFDAQFASASAIDRAMLLREAAAVLRQPNAAWSRPPLALIDVPIGSAAELAFLSELVSVCEPVFATVPAGDDRTRAAFELAGGEIETLVEPSGPEDLLSLRRYLFSEEAPPRRLQFGDVRLLSAPGEARECVEIARRLLEEAAGGIRFDQMAILLRAPQRYLGLLEHALARAGIPAWFDRGVRRPDAAGRAFLAVLACATEKLSAKRFAEYLSLGQVPHLDASGVPLQAGTEAPALPADEVFGAVADLEASEERLAGDEDEAHADGAPDSDDTAVVAGTLRAPWKWERLLVESAVIGGKDRWVRRLDGLSAEYQRKIEEIAREEPESPRLARLQRDLRNLGHLRAFALPIVDTLGSWPEQVSWGEWLVRFEDLAPRVLRHPGRVLRVLADLRPMAGIGPVTLPEARGVLAERLLTIEADPPARRQGRVFIGSPDQARGRAFKVVFVPGLAERLFPQKLREDPMLLDDLRAALDASLPRQHDRASAERLLLRLALGAATDRLYVSYPRLELSESRPRVPSFYALDIVRAITGVIPNHEDLEREAAAVSEATLAWPAPPLPDLAIDDLEHDLASLRPLLDASKPEAVRGHGQYLLRLNDSLRRAVKSRWARAEKAWSPADGIVRITETTRSALQAHRLNARPYSLSALQRYAICPYQFFLSAVYRLEPAERPEPLQRMDPLTRGSLVHSIQTEFFRALESAGALPVSTSTLDGALETLDRTIERVASQYHDELAPAIERVWEDDVASLRADLRVWVGRLAASSEWLPELFEFAFGLQDDPLRDPRSVPDPVAIDGRFLLRGSVDLVERARDARALRVTDHKTGKNRTTPGLIIDGGRILQPVVYGLAVEAALGIPVTSGRLSYCTAAGGFTDHEIPLSPANRRLGVEALEIIDRAVELGMLAAAPAEHACNWCDFRPVCGPDEERRINRKPQNRLAELNELRSRP